VCPTQRGQGGNDSSCRSLFIPRGRSKWPRTSPRLSSSRSSREGWDFSISLGEDFGEVVDPVCAKPLRCSCSWRSSRRAVLVSSSCCEKRRRRRRRKKRRRKRRKEEVKKRRKEEKEEKKKEVNILCHQSFISKGNDANLALFLLLVCQLGNNLVLLGCLGLQGIPFAVVHFDVLWNGLNFHLQSNQVIQKEEEERKKQQRSGQRTK